MKIFLVKSGFDLLIGRARCGEKEILAGLPAELENPMLLRFEKRIVQSALNQPQEVTGYNLVPLSCRKISLADVSYAGEVDAHDPLLELYARIEKAQREQKKSPLLVEQ